MTKEEILKWAKNIQPNQTDYYSRAYIAEIKEAIKAYAGKNNSYYEELDGIPISWGTNSGHIAKDILARFIYSVENDYIGTSLERLIQNDVINDFLDQAQYLLEDSSVHSGAAAMLIGAALEEFLRNWVEGEKLLTEMSKPSIDSYAKLLRQKELLTKQDIKDITSWAGIRNEAAHGHWEEVNDRNRIKIMLEGINHFIRVNIK
jgi:hypothetical protein